MSEKNKKEKDNKALISTGIGAAVGTGVFLATRKPKSLPRTPALQKAKDAYNQSGKITVVDEYPFHVGSKELVQRNIDQWEKLPFKEKIKNPAGYLWNKGMGRYRAAQFRGVDLVDPKNIKDGKKYKGVVVNSSDKNVKGDVTLINTSKGQSDKYDTFVNKDLKAGRAKNLEPYLIPSKSLKDLGISSKMPDDQIKNILNEKAPGHFIKPKSGERSQGLYSAVEDLDSFNYGDKSGMQLLREGLKRDDLLIQPKLDIKQEYRVHAVGGKIADSATVRHGVAKKMSIKDLKGFDTADFEKRLQKELKGRGLDDKNYIIGLDIAKTKDGKFKVIEGNTDSGRAFNFLNPIDNKDMLHQIKGTKTKALPTLTGVTAGTGAGIGTNKLLEKKSSKNTDGIELTDKQKQALKYVLYGAGGAAVGFGGYKGVDHLLDISKLKRNVAHVSREYAEKASDRADHLFQKLGDAGATAGAAATGVGIGAGIYHMLPYSEKEQNRRKIVRSSQSTSTGRIPIDPKYIDKVLKDTSDDKVVSEFKRTSDNTLGNYLRGKKNRPTFGDDSELQVLNKKKNIVYAQNVYGDETTKSFAAKGKNYSIIRDQTSGGIELQLKPGNSDDLYKATSDAIGEGYKGIKLPKGSKLTNMSYAATTKEGVGLGASSHLHFQDTPKNIDKTIKRVVGATAPLNYLVPGADDRAAGYISHNASKIKFGGDLPQARVWANDGEDALTAASELGYTSKKKKSWKPKKGNIATEVRFNAAMHGDPNLSKKFFELSELAISGDEKYSKAFEDLGDYIVKNTGKESKNLHSPEIRKEVTRRFKDIVSNSDFKEDSVLNQMTDALEKGKKIGVKDTFKAWTKLR